MNIFHHIYQSTIAAAVLFFTATSLAHADPTISLHQLERLSNKNYRLRIDRNKIEFNHLELKKLKDESSVELQARVKGGIYQHFSYDGINKHYITRPALGIRYYLFGGNKYQRHIIDKAEPKYYESISFLDATRRQIRTRLGILYTKYWKYGTDYSEVGKIIALLEKQSKHLKDPLQALITRVRMRQGTSELALKIVGFCIAFDTQIDFRRRKSSFSPPEGQKGTLRPLRWPIFPSLDGLRL